MRQHPPLSQATAPVALWGAGGGQLAVGRAAAAAAGAAAELDAAAAGAAAGSAAEALGPAAVAFVVHELLGAAAFALLAHAGAAARSSLAWCRAPQLRANPVVFQPVAVTAPAALLPILQRALEQAVCRQQGLAFRLP